MGFDRPYMEKIIKFGHQSCATRTKLVARHLIVFRLKDHVLVDASSFSSVYLSLKMVHTTVVDSHARPKKIMTQRIHPNNMTVC